MWVSRCRGAYDYKPINKDKIYITKKCNEVSKECGIGIKENTSESDQPTSRNVYEKLKIIQVYSELRENNPKVLIIQTIFWWSKT